MQYFTRHGACVADRLSSCGKTEINSVRQKLQKLGFNPKLALCSTANRCIETAKILAPDAVILVHIDLKIHITWFGDDDDHDQIANATNRAHELIQEHQPDLIVTHDSVATALALRMLEHSGTAVAWNSQPQILRHLQLSQGVLLSNDGTLALTCP